MPTGKIVTNVVGQVAYVSAKLAITQFVVDDVGNYSCIRSQDGSKMRIETVTINLSPLQLTL